MVVNKGPQPGTAVQLGQRLRRARLARNMTQSEVAQKQFSVSYISAVERGQIRPSLGALEKLAERLEVPLADLVRADEPVILPSTATGERVEASGERDEIEQRLREVQVLTRQGNAEAALEALRRMSMKSLNQREQAQWHWHAAFAHLALGRPDEARREIQEAIPLAEQVGDVELRERLRNELGNAYHALHQYQLAMNQYRETYDAVEREGGAGVQDPTFRLTVLYNLGNEAWHLGDFEAAVQYLGQAAQLSQSVLDPEQLAATYWTISATFSSQNDPRRAKLYAARSLAAYEEAGNRQLTARVYNRLGRAHAQSGQADEALVYLGTAYEMAEQQHDAQALAEAKRSLATVYLSQGNVKRAAEAAKEALDMAQALDDLQRAESLLVQARVLEAQKDADGAQKAFEQAIALQEAADATQYLSEAYKQFSDFLERRGDSTHALELLKKAWQVRERVGAGL
ncbi:MAG TPA: tetratricopeptide repeat protein [Ktedonobacterales bacterium]|nr:tetratricopeptide repeat protein [Ktedonobacterales bacterium]